MYGILVRTAQLSGCTSLKRRRQLGCRRRPQRLSEAKDRHVHHLLAPHDASPAEFVLARCTVLDRVHSRAVDLGEYNCVAIGGVNGVHGDEARFMARAPAKVEGVTGVTAEGQRLMSLGRSTFPRRR